MPNKPLGVKSTLKASVTDGENKHTITFLIFYFPFPSIFIFGLSMADENLKKSLKLKAHPVKREDDPYHHHKKIHRDHSDHIPKSPAPKIAGLDSNKSPKPPPPSSSSKPPLPSPSSKPGNLIKKTNETGIGSSSKKFIDDVKPKFAAKEQVKVPAGSLSKVKQEVSSSTPIKKTNSSNVKVKQKKVYSLPGQKHDPPEERDPLRIFYESLYEQIPTSEMATIWMMEHGLLPPDAAKKAYEMRQKKQQQQRTGTPIKSPSVPEKKYSSVSEKKRSFNGDSKGNTSSMKKILSYDDDDDFITKPAKKKVC
ncbi:hypothetical protein KI387_012807 [Taxus chinensis]|uniref:Uncharacterized protein n=1 Tax=Taxus chinensis TaxID=29808 RepID=A0AA38FCR1_TAXCH|nr:hypothetical protein KI387_012807 [Taxus chinensis]